METVKTIFEKAETNILDTEIVCVRRLGKQEGARPILVTFTEENVKSKIFQKSVNFKNMNLSFSNDLTRELREKKKAHFQHLREAKLLLEQRGKVAIIKGSNLEMDNKKYDLPAIQNYLFPGKKIIEERDSCRDNGDSDDSLCSNTSTLSRKRERTLGPKSSQENGLKKKKHTNLQNSIKAYYQMTPSDKDKSSMETA